MACRACVPRYRAVKVGRWPAPRQAYAPPHLDRRAKRGRYAGTCGSGGAHSYQPRKRCDECGCPLCDCRDHDASDRDAFVYRVAHSRAMDVRTTVVSSVPGDGDGQAMKIHNVGAIFGEWSWPCRQYWQ